jgi:hypothetical protein
MTARIDIAHHPGRHCASTALCNLVNFHGIQWSEALCFGIGCGPGIWYIDNGEKPPERIIHVRSADIEEQFFTRIGVPFKWRKYDDPAQSEQDLRRTLDDGTPAMVQTDIYHLPYYNTATHFPGHVITVWGYDADREVFQVTDTERVDALEVPFEAMKRARYCKAGFFDIKGNMFAPEGVHAPGDLPAIMRESIKACSARLLDETAPYQGVRALHTWLGELDRWKNFTGWKWTARFNYQVIERRGTGGGGFRLMYADFLDEAAAVLGEVKALGLPERMREAAGAWTALAMALKSASEEALCDFSEVRAIITRVIDLESSFHREALRL